MGVHHANVFLCEKYRNEMRQFVEEVDQQNYGPLRERTCKAIQRLRQQWPLSNLGWVIYEGGIRKEVMTQEWPLLQHGDSVLIMEDEITGQNIPTPKDVGYWFLIVLAEYLKPCPSPLGNWSVLNAALINLGWKQKNCDLLFRGLPTSMLLKPDVRNKSPEPLKNSDPYWLWLHPSQARSGWLPADEIPKLLKQLSGTEDSIRTFDVKKIPNIRSDNQIVVNEYKEYLSSAYSDTVAMLSAANNMQHGLFMSVTVYA